MLISIFIFLVLFSLVLIIGGYYIEAPVMQIAGTAVLFVTGLLLMFSSVEYESGYHTDYIYGDNYDDYHYNDYNGTTKVSDLNVFHENRTLTYDTWDEEIIQGVQTKHTVAVLILLSSIFIFVSILSQLREGIDDG